MANTDVSSSIAGITTVAVAATLSLLATSTLLLIFCYFYWADITNRIQAGSIKEQFNEKFLKSQFFILLVDLLVSDFIQALGFSLNFAYLNTRFIGQSKVCVTQAVLIQIGDVSSAFAALLIALHTFVVLVVEHPPSNFVLLSYISVKWISTILLAVLGPGLYSNSDLGPFYGPAGGWCWINQAYEPARIYLHYFWLFFAAVGAAICYTAVFFVLRRQIKLKTIRESLNDGEKKSAMANAANKMFYPLCYLVLLSPLGLYRIVGVTGHSWGIQVQLVCGTIFTTAGLVDSLVFSFTRGIFSHSSKSMPDTRKGNTRVSNGSSKLQSELLNCHQDTCLSEIINERDGSSASPISQTDVDYIKSLNRTNTCSILEPVHYPCTEASPIIFRQN